MSRGYAFVTANYRLLVPCTAHDILADVKDVFAFIRDGINKVIVSYGRKEGIDSEKLVAAGNSAGATCAYLAAMHADPKPKALLSVYGMGGHLLVKCFVIRFVAEI